MSTNLPTTEYGTSKRIAIAINVPYLLDKIFDAKYQVVNAGVNLYDGQFHDNPAAVEYETSRIEYYLEKLELERNKLNHYLKNYRPDVAKGWRIRDRKDELNELDEFIAHYRSIIDEEI